MVAHRSSYQMMALGSYMPMQPGNSMTPLSLILPRSADVRNDIYINYGNNYNSQVTATDAASIALYGYKAESINSRVQGAVDAQLIADRYIDQRAYPIPAFQSITFPITNPEINNADRDDLLAVFMGMPVHITHHPKRHQIF